MDAKSNLEDKVTDVHILSLANTREQGWRGNNKEIEEMETERERKEG